MDMPILHAVTGPYMHGISLIFVLGSGQKLLANLLDQHPFVTMRQPTKVVRQFSTFGELWYDENPRQIEAQRLEQERTML